MSQSLDHLFDAPLIRVIGVGNGGGDAVRHMAAAGIEGADFVHVHTDTRAPDRASITSVPIGRRATGGRGTAGDPVRGREAAREDRDALGDLVRDVDLLVLVATMGGGTGSGAAPEIARIARELEVLTIGVVTEPFPFDPEAHGHVAEEGIAALARHVDSLIALPVGELLRGSSVDASPFGAFASVGAMLHATVRIIVETITVPSVLGVDFSDMRKVMEQRGRAAAAGSGCGHGEGRVAEAIANAVSSPMLAGVDLHHARGLLVVAEVGTDVLIEEIGQAVDALDGRAADDAVVVLAMVPTDLAPGELRVTIVATGLPPTAVRASVPAASSRHTPRRQASCGSGNEAGVARSESGGEADDAMARTLVRSARVTSPGPAAARFGGAACGAVVAVGRGAEQGGA